VENENDCLIPPHGGYRTLKSFHVAQLAYDVTVRFCDRYVDRFSRTRDQMIQAARSGVQNIAEGSQASGTSKKTELTLTSVARSSLEELRLDYEDFLRHRGLRSWDRSDPRTGALIAKRPQSAEEVAEWVKETRAGRFGPTGLLGPDGPSTESTKSTQSTSSTSSSGPSSAEIAANGALALVRVACSLLDRQIASLARAFQAEGGFSERLFRARSASRNRNDKPDKLSAG
jgi:four helix bundle suffix protein